MSTTTCSHCEATAVIHTPYDGRHLCETHLLRSVEKRARRRIRADGLFDGSPVTWLVGVSGGKDSAVLTTILAETFADNPQVTLRGLCIHEGIEGYRDESLEAARDLVERFDVPLAERTYADLYDLEMDDVAAEDPLDMAPCAYCGVFRRDALERHASAIDADVLFTGHNLDDEAQTALMNVLEGDVDQIAKHYDASLAPMDDRTPQDRFVPRAKPLRDVPEKEVALYAHLRDLPVHFADCPHAERSFRGELKRVLHDLEADHPGTRHSILSGYEDLAALAADARESAGDGAVGSCAACGQPAAGEYCRACQLRSAIEAT